MFIHQGTASVVDFFSLYTWGKNPIFLSGILNEFAKVGVLDFFMSVANAQCNVCALEFGFPDCCLKLIIRIIPHIHMLKCIKVCCKVISVHIRFCTRENTNACHYGF